MFKVNNKNFRMRMASIMLFWCFIANLEYA